MQPQDNREIGSALRRVLQAGREMQATLSRGLGLRVTDVQAVDHVASAEQPMGTVELGNRLGMRSSSAVALVNRLVEAGHLAREPDPRDRRRVVLVPTTDGRAEVHGILTPMLEQLRALIDELNEDEAAAVLWFLQEAAVTLRDFDKEARPEPHRRP